ncbi:MAG: Slp family lipoprotein [Gammaproteobacteria bacterium]
MRILLCVFALALLSGCATVPEPLRGEFPTVTPQGSVSQGINNQRVRWGGVIVEAMPGRDETCFEVLGQNLNDQGRPIESVNSQGRFIACAQGFYDPAVYAKGRDLTVVGTLNTTVTRKIGEYDYRYPQLAIQQVYLWPETRTYAERPYGYPYDYPYYGYPYGYPYGGGLSLGFFNNYYPGHYYHDRRPVVDKPKPPATPSREWFNRQKPAPSSAPPVSPSSNFQKSAPTLSPGPTTSGFMNRFRSSEGRL